MITNAKTAREFAQSIAVQAVQTQNAIDATDWMEASDLIMSIMQDVERLQQYISAKVEEIEEAR
jgi:hypothetical protein